MTSHFQFVEPAASPAAPNATLFVYEGPDWCLEELRNSAGTMLHSWSYEILEVKPAGRGVVREIVPRGHDWVGSCLLRSYEVPCRLLKEDEKGVWLQLGAWERLQWPAEDRAAAEAWKTGSAAAAVALAAAAANPIRAEGEGGTKRVETAVGRGGEEGGSRRGRGGSSRGGGRGRGGHGRGGAHGGSSGSREQAIASAAAAVQAAVCRIRLPTLAT